MAENENKTLTSVLNARYPELLDTKRFPLTEGGLAERFVHIFERHICIENTGEDIWRWYIVYNDNEFSANKMAVLGLVHTSLRIFKKEVEHTTPCDPKFSGRIQAKMAELIDKYDTDEGCNNILNMVAYVDCTDEIINKKSHRWMDSGDVEIDTSPPIQSLSNIEFHLETLTEILKKWEGKI